MGFEAEPARQVSVHPAVDRGLGRPQRQCGTGRELRCEFDAVAYTSAAGTTTSTSPISRASSAGTNRPVYIRSLAFAGPINRGRRCVPPPPGMIPSSISGWPQRASSALTRKSAARASSHPPPSAYPVTAATTGLGSRRHHVEGRTQPLRVAHHVGMAHPGELFDIRSGRKHLLPAVDHHRTDGIVGRELCDRAAQLLLQLAIQRVHRWPVQPDCCYRRRAGHPCRHRSRRVSVRPRLTRPEVQPGQCALVERGPVLADVEHCDGGGRKPVGQDLAQLRVARPIVCRVGEIAH